VQSEPSSVRPDATFSPRIPNWQLGILIAIMLWLYSSILVHLVAQWWKSPDFSHGFFVPLFSAFVVWQERAKLAGIALRPSWFGLPMVVIAMFTLIVGQLGAELFLSRSSLLILLAGLIVLFGGWQYSRALFFPWAFLILMIPIPAIIFNQITFPLQLLASRVSSLILPMLGVPVLREGNVINLPAMPLEVAEACSGIRSLMTLIALAIVYGYLLEKRIWVRWVLALASVPIAVAANSVRIIGTGLLVQYWDPEKAEGYFHASWGVITFVLSLLMLYALHGLINLILKKAGAGDGTNEAWPHGTLDGASLQGKMTRSMAGFVTVALILCGSAIFLQARTRSEVLPNRRPLGSFPEKLGGMDGTDVEIPAESLQVLGPGDFLLRVYDDDTSANLPVDLFIAYFPSQRAGDTIHSPKNCLPGAGWAPVQSSRIMLSSPGQAPFPVNRYVIAKGDARKLVLYWYWAHNRGVASEYWAKYYLVADSIRMDRSDGSLVRLGTTILPGETVEAAQQRLMPFANRVLPLLNDYIPR